MKRFLLSCVMLLVALATSMPAMAIEDPAYSKEVKKLNVVASGFIMKKAPTDKDMQKVLDAFNKITAPADLGAANLFMGETYLKCKAPFQSYDKSFEHYQKAYELLTDNTPVLKSKSRLMLGLHYFSGKAVAQDFEKTFELYDEAATINPALSMGLGRLYELGLGVPQDLFMAMTYYDAACQNGADSYGLLYAAEYALEQIEAGKLDAEAFEAYQYGVYLEEVNQHTDQISEAMPYLEKAAAKGYAPAYFEIGTLYLIDRNYSLAEDWLTKGAEANYAPAINNLGMCYYNWTMFKAFQYDKITKEIQCFERGAEMGFAPSQHMLGAFYFQGYGTIQYRIPKDLSLAYKWFTAAANQGYPLSQTWAETTAKQIKAETIKSIASQIKGLAGNVSKIGHASTISKATNSNYKQTITNDKSVSSDGSYSEMLYHRYAQKAISQIQHYGNIVARYNNSKSSHSTAITGLNYQSTERLIKTYINEMKKCEEDAIKKGRTINKSADELEVEKGDVMAFLKSHKWG